MIHTKFRGNRSTDSGENGFTIYGSGDHLGHVASIMLMKIHFMYLKVYIQSLVENGSMVYEKSMF